MAENDYGGSYDEGRSGGMYTGGNSIDYAGYLAGQNARASAEAASAQWASGGSVSGGGGVVAGPPMNLAQKAMRLGVIFGMIGLPLGAFIQPSVFGAVLGVAAGFASGFVARMGLELVIRPFRPASGGYGFLPAVLLGGFGGMFIGGPILGVAAAVVLFVVWMARNRG